MVCIHVSEIGRSLRFYRDLPGIPLEQHPEAPWKAPVDLPCGVRLLVAIGRRTR